MSSDELRDAIAAALYVRDRFDSPCSVLADAILALPEMQEMLAMDARLDAAVTLWGKAFEAMGAQVATLTADCAAWEVLHKRRMELIATLTDNLDATRAERDRLRTAGDALAEQLQCYQCHCSMSKCRCGHDAVLDAWQEARNA